MQNQFLQTIRQWIHENNLIEDSKEVVVALSGGPDSVCLLSVLKELGYKVGAVHVNHHLRETADRDQRFSEEIAEKLGVPAVTEDVDVKKMKTDSKRSTEEAARILRYEALERGAKKLFPGEVPIATGHHTDDQAETVLFHLIRGAGVRGAGGIAPKTGRVIRPLLPVTHEAILNYLLEKDLPFVIDETNEEDDMARNRIRHHVIPELKAIRPDAAEKIAEASMRFREAEAFLTEEAGKALQAVRLPGEKNEVRLDAGAFASLPVLMKRYVVREAMKELGTPERDKTSVHYQAVASLDGKSVGKEITLPGGGYAVRTYDAVVILREKDAPRADARFRMEIRRVKNDEKKPANPYTKRFDCDKINGNVPVLRTREPYDRIAIAPGMHKTLKRFMIDEKIPKAERGRIPVVAVGHEVLWIVGYRTSCAFHPAKDAEEALEITIIEE
ncbi:MAG: tRNA lysidine(34) synthetase TilS [Lachnospiraceae bacterium]|nr:tRNA lysidine(34) synthetase TilS [Lachnospiraceae bacterium]